MVDNVSFSVLQGEIVAIVGPSGAGKTTLIEMITGLLSVTSGDIQIMTKSVKDELDDIRERYNIGFCQ